MNPNLRRKEGFIILSQMDTKIRVHTKSQCIEILKYFRRAKIYCKGNFIAEVSMSECYGYPCTMEVIGEKWDFCLQSEESLSVKTYLE